MKNGGMGIKHPKVRGEWVELRFMMRAMELGLHLSRPCGEVRPYDFVVECEGRLVRVQVKSTMFVDRGGYSCTVRGSDGPYEGDPFDLLAAYIFQEDPCGTSFRRGWWWDRGVLRCIRDTSRRSMGRIKKRGIC